MVILIFPKQQNQGKAMASPASPRKDPEMAKWLASHQRMETAAELERKANILYSKSHHFCHAMGQLTIYSTVSLALPCPGAQCPGAQCPGAQSPCWGCYMSFLAIVSMAFCPFCSAEAPISWEGSPLVNPPVACRYHFAWLFWTSISIYGLVTFIPSVSLRTQSYFLS
jgi:hypothetical protein